VAVWSLACLSHAATKNRLGFAIAQLGIKIEQLFKVDPNRLSSIASAYLRYVPENKQLNPPWQCILSTNPVLLDEPLGPTFAPSKKTRSIVRRRYIWP